MILHPAIWKQVSKMYRWYYKTDIEIQRVFEILNIKDGKAASLSNLLVFLNGLTYDQGIDVMKDVLQLQVFWPTENDYIKRRNDYNQRQFYSGLPPLLAGRQPPEYCPPEERLFGEELSNLLSNLCGIVYDKYTRTLSVQNPEGIHQIPSTINAQLLVNLEFEDYFFKTISQELNAVHRAGFYNSTLLLARKLFENLLIRLLEYKYPKNLDGNLELYYDVSQNRYKGFSELINSLREKRKDFVDGHSTIKRFITKIEKLTDITNPTAHKLTYNASQKDVDLLEVTEQLELFKKICELVSLDKIFKN